MAGEADRYVFQASFDKATAEAQALIDQLAKDIDLFKERKERKKVSLNEKELRDQLKKDDADKIDQKVNDVTPMETSSGTAYKFKRTFVNDEILNIMTDFLQGKKLLADRGK